MNLQQELEPETPNQIAHVKVDSLDCAVEMEAHATYSDPRLDRLNRATLRRKRNYVIANTCSISTIPTMLLMLLTSRLVTQIPNVSAALFTLFVALILGMFAFVWKGARESRLAAAALEDIDDVRAVGPLVQALELADPKYRPALVIPSDLPAYNAAVPILKRLLPKLTTNDAELLNGRQREYLHRALKFSIDPRQKKLYDLDFAIAILQALTAVGTKSSLSYVQALESLKGESEKAGHVRALAESCARAIQARIEEGLKPARLLRAVEAPQSPESVLLRPTVGSAKTETDSLLQPSNAPRSGDS